jgi:toxin-antitoxin system PIN domain toxin
VILWDVNLWVYAFRSDSPLHGIAHSELEHGSRLGDSFLFCHYVVASFLRLVTNPRIFAQPSSIEEAWGFADALESRERAVRADIDPMTYGIFKHVCLVSKAAGNRVPDALLAAVAIRHDATLVTVDRGFSRFEGLACRYLSGGDSLSPRAPGTP